MEKAGKGYLKNTLIGLFVVVAIIIIVWFLLFFKPTIGDGKVHLRVRFSSIANISIGTRVTFAGRPVGEVITIKQIYQAREQPSDIIGRPYFYELVLAVDSSVKVYNSDAIEIQTSGLLGEKSIAIIPKAFPAEGAARLMNNHIIYAEALDPVATAFNSMAEASDRVGRAMEDISTIIESNKEYVSSSFISMDITLKELAYTMSEINRLGIIETISYAGEKLRKLMANANDVLTEVRYERIPDKIGRVLINVDKITGDIAYGRGTLGRLVTDPGLYLQTVATMNKMDTMMNDINHYGFFFHLNKGWQRTRVQRINSMNSLKTPKEFRKYFETEMDQVTTSLSRLSQLVDKAASKHEDIMDDNAFEKVFGDLLREVTQLQEIVELYNEKLVQSKK